MNFPVDLRTVVAVILTLSFAHLGLGRAVPFDISNGVELVTTFVLFAGYLYLMRTLIRLPAAVVISIRRTRYARRQYKLSGIESLRDGYTRGFLETRRWTVEPLALVDRVVICVATLLATIPGLGGLLVTLGGFLGIALMLILYLMRGTFSWLVADQLDNSVQSSSHMPFINRRD
ncbi:MAG: hypothetical protein GC179_23875 [Anaerolineaceae bacterium]|nr:hypothetical protein [Anaerolineaceae bacterium]